MYTVKNYPISTTQDPATTPAVPLNVNDYQAIARGKLSKALYEYIASGTDDEQTLRANRSAFLQWYLRPRVLRPVGSLSTRIQLFGHTLSMPVFASPAGVQAVAHEHGECATARACARAGILFGLSQHATRSIEQVAAEAPQTVKWFQCYILRDREVTRRLVQRAIQTGYSGIILTVDSVRFGYREADGRNGYVP
jgi:isopentenyl diphosphate isomerase/L-lactate dehydrogenase-like FMN-dependent dehydrogenase